MGRVYGNCYAYTLAPNTKGLYFEAVSWSGIGLIRDPDPTTSEGVIENPVFVSEYPNIADRQNIFNIFTAENTGTTSGSASPLINNTCN